MSLATFLSNVVEILRELRIPHMLTGSLAAAYYSTPRATQDVDLVIETSEDLVETLVERLSGAGLYVDGFAALEAYRSGGQFNAIDPETGWKVDLIFRRSRAFSAEEFTRRTPGRVLGVEVALTTIEDLIIAKLEWAALGDSELQRRDVIALLERSEGIGLDQTYMDRWIQTLGLSEEWDSILRRMGAR